MKNKDIVINFERRLQVMFPELLEEKPSSDLILQYINDAINRFVTTRFTGMNYKLKSFEQDQKRIDDLRTLVKSQFYTFDKYDDPSIDGISLPGDYMFLLGEQASITSDDKCWPIVNGKPIVKTTDVLEATIENIDKQRANHLSEHLLHANTARPLRLIKGNSVYLYTDGNYTIVRYNIDYLRKPSKVTLESPMSEYTDLTDTVMHEVINIAVTMYLADKGDQRYNVAQNEVQLME